MRQEGPLSAAMRLWPDQEVSGFDYFDFLHARGSPRQALFYAGLYWPDFVLLDEMVFLRSMVEDDEDRGRVEAALIKFDGDKRRTEQSFNTVEVPSLFGRRLSETSDAEDEAIARLIREMWSARLHKLFGELSFRVEVVPAGEETAVAVSFWQE